MAKSARALVAEGNVDDEGPDGDGGTAVSRAEDDNGDCVGEAGLFGEIVGVEEDEAESGEAVKEPRVSEITLLMDGPEYDALDEADAGEAVKEPKATDITLLVDDGE